MTSAARELPSAVYAASQVRELDRRATELFGIPSYELMCRAGAAALAALRTHWPAAERVTVLCGSGNNAGDGYVLARLARRESLAVRVLAATDPERLKGDAARAFADCTASGVAVERLDARADALARERADVLVDALLGIGADRPLEGALGAAVDAANAARVPILALDVPSGLHADTGRPLGRAIRAAVTITFVGLKQGLYLAEACDYVGTIELADLGVPPEAHDGLRAPLERLASGDLERALPRRARSAHKGTSGRLLIVGGGPGMPGAVRLAAEAALRSGAGLVYVACHPESVGSVLSGRPEVIARSADSPASLDDLIALVDAAALGPGLGRSDWARALAGRVEASELPLVVDADGLNWLAETPHARGRWILTPHPAEAARLLAASVDAVQGDRRGSARALADRYDAVAVLKGARTLVAEPGTESVHVCDRGNPGMATAGTGDVLTGVIGALLVQTHDLALSARAGVLLHALAGDSAAAAGERGTLAGDLLPYLRQWANPS